MDGYDRKSIERTNRIMFCPKCGLYTGHLFLRLDDKMNTQSIGYVCDACNSTTFAFERNKVTGMVTKRYIAPGFKL